MRLLVVLRLKLLGERVHIDLASDEAGGSQGLYATFDHLDDLLNHVFDLFADISLEF